MNYETILNGFAAMGIPVDEIRPRENVLTFNAWKALGRHVRKGQHGVKALTFVAVGAKQETNGENKAGYRMPRTVTVFHISQTEPDSPRAVPAPAIFSNWTPLDVIDSAAVPAYQITAAQLLQPRA
jgi:antirestriction protein ArdC